MPHVHFRSRPWSLRRALAQALVVSLIPMGTAFAQSAPYVRVTREEIPISSFRNTEGWTLMTAPRGTVLEVALTRGDQYSNRDANWYWVLLPPDSWGTQRLGWISGRDVERVPPPERAKAAPVPKTRVVERPRAQPALEQPSRASVLVAPEVRNPAPAAVPTAVTPEVSEVVLHFEFGKSNLSDEARRLLAGAVGMLKANAQSVSFALDGHADWTGPEAFNERLGLLRAEAVKRHLAEQHQIPVDKISVVSHGESQPAASNATREGRAENRRVVVKVSM